MVLAITPLVLYGSMVLVPLVLAVALRFVIVVPTRECIQCGTVVAVTTLTCRHCGHRYTAEDRELMRLAAERRSSQAEAREPAPRMPSAPPRPARPLTGVPRMDCVACGGKVPPTALSCRHCGRRYSPEDRRQMRLSAGLPATPPDPLSSTRARADGRSRA
jgi:ribosomal protein L40E